MSAPPRMTVADRMALDRMKKQIRSENPRRVADARIRRMMNDWVERGMGQPKGHVAPAEKRHG